MTFHIITIFPDIFSSYFNESIIKRALEKNQIEINIVNLRDFATDKHKTVDDTPYGGGAGMVMKIEPLYRAVRSLKKQETRNNNQTISNFPAQGWSASGGQFPISKKLLNDLISKFLKGVKDGDDVLKAKQAEYLGEGNFRMVLTEGKNRQIRRMFAFFGLDVLKLQRVRMGSGRLKFELGKLKKGEWRCVKLVSSE